jgi:alkylation response protein AidB-like acyl-CoA dehydrogenase
MDFELPVEDDPRRLEVRRWLAEHPSPDGRTLAEAGYVVPHWPQPWGLDADPLHQLIIDDELRRAGVRRPGNAIGIGWAAPTIFLAGTDEQKRRFLPKIFSGEEVWCQMFSEPDAGSDLASLATRAERDGDEYVVNGSKIWTSGGHHSQFGILIARTEPDAPKHKGITYFICPTDLPGLTMTPIIDMTRAHSFNQVFFDNVRIPANLRVGEEGDGWRLAKVTLANERVSLSSGGVLWGAGPSWGDLLGLIRAQGGTIDPVLRQRIAALHAEATVLDLNRMRTLTARLQGRTPGPEASIQKLMADEHGQRVVQLAADLVGAHAMIEGSGPAGLLPTSSRSGPTENKLDTHTYPDVDPVWSYAQLFAPALTIGGGTFAVQRNIVAELVLGLPREPDIERGLSWAETRHQRSR